MLWNDNTCNKDLGRNVELGEVEFFECPPICFSPHNQEEGHNTIDDPNARNPYDDITSIDPDSFESKWQKGGAGGESMS